MFFFSQSSVKGFQVSFVEIVFERTGLKSHTFEATLNLTY